ncbi:DUF4863 family protein [Pelagibius sp. Alg239-R121]|uniref:4-hydroxylaminobenzoate lyase n=1 Tax=Pelagibius sp. Alg239-R121 TaxID=2993448 RepID=UPI0024A64AA4|nr:DUF4863 family protein [Pelagibius sp. Alg239-R121]
MAQADFERVMSDVAATIGERALDDDLAVFLNTQIPAEGDVFQQVEALCRDGEAEGWLCAREMGGIRFGRAIKPGAQAGRFSVDVVRMTDVKGPHHIHTQGEIGMIMPVEGDAKFDDIERGWYVYPAGSDHWPTVTGGDAYILYLLPDGAIEFTGK